MNAGEDDENMWSPERLSAFLDVPVNTLYQWRSRGTGPKGRRVGKHLRYLREDVYAWVRGLS